MFVFDKGIVLAEKIKNNTFNVGGGIKNAISLKDLTLKCQLITNNKVKIGKNKKTSNHN